MAKHSTGTFFERLRAFDEFYEPVQREMAAWLKPARGGMVAEIGCGAGGMARLFAEAVGATGAVMATEINPEKVAAVRELLARTPDAERISVREAELPALPFENDTFDLAWSSRVVHHLSDPVAGIRELARVTKHGGRVVLREDKSGARFLPHDVGIGEPGVEERLHIAQSRWFDRMHHDHEHGTRYPHGWLRALREAGLVNVTAKSFLYELTAPFTAQQTAYLRGWLHDAAANDEYPLSESDRATLLALTDAASEQDAFRRDDLHLLYVGSLYVGEKG